MASENLFNALSNVLQQSNILTIIGYQYAASLGSPHYHDIQSGVWSAASTRFNPLKNSSQLNIVWDWFLWRAAIPVTHTAPLRLLQQQTNCRIISQNIDTGLQDAGINVETALYGNLHLVKCVHNSHILPYHAIQQLLHLRNFECPTCQSPLLPDVQMFGWNSKHTLQQAAALQLLEADSIIYLGEDRNLAPFTLLSRSQHTTLQAIPSLHINHQRLSLRTPHLTDTITLESMRKQFPQYMPNGMMASELTAAAQAVLTLWENAANY